MNLFKNKTKEKQAIELKDSYGKEMSDIHKQTKKLEKKTIELNNRIVNTTAYKIYVATGGITR